MGCRNTFIVAAALSAMSTVVSAENVRPYVYDIQPLSDLDCKIMQQHKTLQPDNPVSCKRLNAVNFSYYSDDGVVKADGKLVVLDVIAPEVALLMGDLYNRKAYIKKSKPLEEYNGIDSASMIDNNTSAFNGRKQATAKRWSLHAYGVVIDYNPVQNPVIYPNQEEDDHGNIIPGRLGEGLIRPVISSSNVNNYLNRNVYRARSDSDGFFRSGMAEPVVSIFADHGFLMWGGYWNDPVDYQHFEVGPRSFIERLYGADPVATTNPVNGKKLFADYIGTYKQCLLDKAQELPDGTQLRAQCSVDTIKRFSGGKIEQQ